MQGKALESPFISPPSTVFLNLGLTVHNKLKDPTGEKLELVATQLGMKATSRQMGQKETKTNKCFSPPLAPSNTHLQFLSFLFCYFPFLKRPLFPLLFSFRLSWLQLLGLQRPLLIENAGKAECILILVTGCNGAYPGKGIAAHHMPKRRCSEGQGWEEEEEVRHEESERDRASNKTQGGWIGDDTVESGARYGGSPFHSEVRSSRATAMAWGVATKALDVVASAESARSAGYWPGVPKGV